MTRVFVALVWVVARYEAISPYDEQEREVRLFLPPEGAGSQCPVFLLLSCGSLRGTKQSHHMMSKNAM
jgi:hypothetical protein